MAANLFIETIRAKASNKQLTVGFPDAEDIRSIEAAVILQKENIARAVLIGNKIKIHNLSSDNGLNIDGIMIYDPSVSEHIQEFAHILFEKRKSKGMTLIEASIKVADPLYYGGLLLETGRIDACVGGNISSTGNVLRAAIHTVGVAEGISVVSSYFIMILPDKMFCFADCAVNPDPNPEQLADIAISSAANYQAVTGEQPKIAMLSFSTKGSADHPHVDKVVSATNIIKEKSPGLAVDGELQLDAAIIKSIGEKKSPGSPVAGSANVLIFPDLDAGNIGYKLTQRLAGAEAIGPIVQGLNKPYCDLSRGCSSADMVNVAAICTLMA